MSRLDNDNIELIDSWRRVYHDKDTIQLQTQLAIAQNVKSRFLRINVITGHPLCAIEMKVRATASMTASVDTGESLLEAALSEFIIESVEGVEWFAFRGGGGTATADCMEAFKAYCVDWNNALVMGDTTLIANGATSQVLEQVITLPIFLPQDFYGQHRIYCVGSADFTGAAAEISNVTIDFTFVYTPSNDARPWNIIYQDLADNLNKTGIVNVNIYLPEEVVIMSYWLSDHDSYDWYKAYDGYNIYPFDAHDAVITRMLWRSAFQEYIQEDWSMSLEYSAVLRYMSTYAFTTYLGGTEYKAQGIESHTMRMVHETYHNGEYTGFLYGPSSTQQFTMRTAVTRAGVLLITITTVDDFPGAGAENPLAPVGPNTMVAQVSPSKVVKTQSKVVRNTLSRSGPTNTRRLISARKA